MSGSHTAPTRGTNTRTLLAKANVYSPQTDTHMFVQLGCVPIHMGSTYCPVDWPAQLLPDHRQRFFTCPFDGLPCIRLLDATIRKAQSENCLRTRSRQWLLLQMPLRSRNRRTPLVWSTLRSMKSRDAVSVVQTLLTLDRSCRNLSVAGQRACSHYFPKMHRQVQGVVYTRQFNIQMQSMACSSLVIAW